MKRAVWAAAVVLGLAASGAHAAEPSRRLDGTSWSIELTALSKRGPGQLLKDRLLFEADTLNSERLTAHGYPTAPISIEVEPDGTVTWESMQSKEGEGVAFWRGEWRAGTMQGTMSHHQVAGPSENYTFFGTPSGSAPEAPQPAVGESPAGSAVPAAAEADELPAPPAALSFGGERSSTLASQIEAVAADLRERLRQKDATIGRLQQQVRQLQSDLDARTFKRDELAEQLLQTQRSKTAATEELTATRTTLSAAQRDLENTRRQLEETDRDRAVVQEEMRRHRDLAMGREREIESTHQQMNLMKTAEEALKSDQHRMGRTLEQKDDELAAQRNAIAKLEQRTSSLQGELDTALEDLRQVKTKFSEANNDKERLEQASARLTKQQAALSASLKDTQTDAAKVKITQEERRALQKLLTDAQTELAAVKQAHADQTQRLQIVSGEFQAMKKERDAFGQMVGDIKGAEQQLTEQLRRLTSEAATLPALTQERDSLARQLQAAQEGEQLLQRELEATGVALQQEKERVLELRQTLAAHDQEVAEAQTTVANAQTNAARWKAQLDASQQRERELASEAEVFRLTQGRLSQPPGPAPSSAPVARPTAPAAMAASPRRERPLAGSPGADVAVSWVSVPLSFLVLDVQGVSWVQPGTRLAVTFLPSGMLYATVTDVSPLGLAMTDLMPPVPDPFPLSRGDRVRIAQVGGS